MDTSFNNRCIRRAVHICGWPLHPFHGLFTLLPSGTGASVSPPADFATVFFLRQSDYSTPGCLPILIWVSLLCHKITIVHVYMITIYSPNSVYLFFENIYCLVHFFLLLFIVYLHCIYIQYICNIYLWHIIWCAENRTLLILNIKVLSSLLYFCSYFCNRNICINVFFFQLQNLLDTYYPIEIDSTCSVEEKLPLMVEW